MCPVYQVDLCIEESLLPSRGSVELTAMWRGLTFGFMSKDSGVVKEDTAGCIASCKVL